MLTFPQIKAKLAKRKLSDAKFVRVHSPRVGFDKKTGFPFYVCRTSSTMIWNGKRYVRNPRASERYLTVVSVLDKKGHIEISCSCPDFLFRHEVALAEKDASSVEYSNGDYPKVTNPLLRPTCCKHCLAFYSLLHSKGLVK